MIEIQAPDGSVVQFPDGTPDATIEQAMRAEYGGPDEATSGKGFMGTIGDIASRANDALLFGAGEEFRAGFKALPSLFPGGESFSDTFSKNLATENARRGRIQTERPVVDVVGSTAGLGAQMGTGLALQAANIIPGVATTAMGRIAQAAGTGGIVGGVSGLADTESDRPMGERGLFGIGIGTAIGGAVGTAVEGVSALVSKLLAKNPKDAALQRIAKRMTDQDLTPDQALAAKKEATRVGADDYALIDVGGRNGNAGTQLQRLGRNVADSPGKGSAILDDFVTGRHAGQYERLTNAVGRDVSPIVPKDEVQTALKEAAKKAVAPLYKLGGDDIVPVTKTLKMDLSKPSVAKAWSKVQSMAAEEGVQLEPLFINGKFNPRVEQISGRTAHYIREAMDDLVGAETKILPNGTKEMSNVGRAYSVTRRYIDTALKNASKSFRQADDIYTKMNLFKNAIEGGSKYATKTPDQLAGTLARMSPRSKAMYRLGAAWDMARKLASVRDSRDLSKVFMASPADRQRLSVLVGGERNLQNMLSTLKAEKEMASSFTKITGGSRTSAQLADEAAEGARGVANFVRSGPYQGLKNTVARVIETMGGMSEAERKAVAEILTATDETGFAELMQLITKKQVAGAGRNQVQGAIEQLGTLELTRR